MGFPNQRKTIGFLIDELIGQYQSFIWQGVVKAAELKNVNLVIFPGRIMGKPENEFFQHSSIYEIISKKRIDGLIITSAIYSIYHDKTYMKRFFDRYGIPYVTIGFQIGNEPSVQVDNKQGMRELVDHFIEKHGYKRIAFIRGPVTNAEAELRFQAYTESLAAHGLPFDESLVETGTFWGPTGAQAVERLATERKVHFDACIAANDDMAIAAYHLLRQKEFRIPQDVAVGGFDNVEQGHFLFSSLTTVEQPVDEIALKAIEFTCDMLDGKTAPSVTRIPARLVVKRSCGCYSTSIMKLQTGAEHHAVEIKKSPAAWEEETLAEVREIFPSSMPIDVILFFTHMLLEYIAGKSREHAEEEMLFASFYEMLLADTCLGCSVQTWNQYLTLMYNRALCWFAPSGLDFATSAILHKLRVLTADGMELKDGVRRMTEERMIFNIQNVVQLFSISYHADDLLKRIISEFPRLNINSFYICLFDTVTELYADGSWKIPETIALYVAHDYKNLLASESIGRKIQVTEMVPDEFLPHDRRVTYIASPLFFGNFHFGYSLFEPGLRYSFLSETLRSQISSILQASYLFEKNNANQARLKQKSERIHALVRPMIDSIKETDSVSRVKMNDISTLNEITDENNKKLMEANKSVEMIASNIEEILGLISTIDDISVRINLLSINASIEASRAGTKGKGFAVIAAEVRKLAESTARNAKTTSESLKSLIARIRYSETVSKESVVAFKKIQAEVNDISSTFSDIAERMSVLSETSKEIISVM